MHRIALHCVAAALAAAGPLVACPPTSSGQGAPGTGAPEPATAQRPAWKQQDPRYGLLTPLPDHGGVPAIVELLNAPTREELELRARMRGYEKDIRTIRKKYLGDIRKPAIRQRGLDELREFTDPAAFAIMYGTLRDEADDVRTFVLDHLAAQGDLGQATLAWIAIHESARETDPTAAAALRHAAISRLTSPAPPAVAKVIEDGLRTTTHQIANNAGVVAGAVNAIQMIPLMMFAQVTADTVRNEGDLAWIAVGTQEYFVTEMRAVVSDGAIGFIPVISPQQTGVVLRVVDAVAVVYRTDVHRTLVAMSSHQWGRRTDDLGYDPARWWAWYNQEFVPHMKHKLEMERAAAGAAQPAPAGPVS